MKAGLRIRVLGLVQREAEVVERLEHRPQVDLALSNPEAPAASREAPLRKPRRQATLPKNAGKEEKTRDGERRRGVGP